MIELLMDGVMAVLGVAVKKIFPDKSPEEITSILEEVKPEIQAAIEASAMKAQAAINSTEASSTFKFVAYARDVLLYMCIGVIGYSYVVCPCVHFFVPHLPMPQFNNDLFYSLLLGMLGLGTAHSYMRK